MNSRTEPEPGPAHQRIRASRASAHQEHQSYRCLLHYSGVRVNASSCQLSSKRRRMHACVCSVRCAASTPSWLLADSW
eukprot:181792-Rhodomonas_salina.1